MQIRRRVGRTAANLGEKEATSRGPALLALEQLGVIDKPSDLPPHTGQVFEPDPSRHALYRAAVQRQAELYETVIA